jgi:pimeloyl-ACP methyl ester carboxylesterase
VEDLFELVRTLGIRQAVFGGLSMGGYLSLRFYLRHPDMVTALIIMDTGPGYRNPARMAEWNKSREEMAQRLEKEGINVLLEQARAGGRSEISLKQNPVGLAHMSRNVVGQHDSWVIENLDKVRVPALILVGEKDTAFLQAADYMAKTIPGANKFVVPNAGHPANIDNPEFFNARILEFLHGLALQAEGV